jgi:hypothetical protein
MSPRRGEHAFGQSRTEIVGDDERGLQGGTR